MGLFGFGTGTSSQGEGPGAIGRDLDEYGEIQSYVRSVLTTSVAVRRHGGEGPVDDAQQRPRHVSRPSPPGA
jgi:hypothetical protein